MGLFAKKNSCGSASQRRAKKETIAHLSQFVASRAGVAAYYEAESTHNPSALVLVAMDGEWTRRKIPSLADAVDVAQDLGIELYEVTRSGYPRAMREWSAKRAHRR